jgi:predicted membrane chloride channel (bestrophin family)
MPLAYVQLLQILVDSLVYLSPFSLYSSLGSLSIPLCGLLALFFKGLLELSKSFLDPFGNEGFPGQNIRVDVLVSEMNFGTTTRWVKAAEYLPVRQKQK